MKRKLQHMLMILLGIIFVFSVGMQIRQKTFYQKGETTYNKAKEIAGVKENPDTQKEEKTEEADANIKIEPEKTQESNKQKKFTLQHIHTKAPIEINLEALKEINSDVIGWIVIPHTEISYPIVQGEDNSYYLKHTWDKENNNVGAIFMEARNSAELNDFNTIVYGHRMRDNSMFGRLKYYVDQEYWKQHPQIYVIDESGGHKYDIFAAYEVTVEDGVFDINFESEEEKQKYINECLEKSVINTKIVPEVKDEILTLSTCTANGKTNRWIVQGVIRCE